MAVAPQDRPPDRASDPNQDSLTAHCSRLIDLANATAPAGLDPIRFAFDAECGENLYHGVTPPPEPAPEVQKAICEYKFARAVHRTQDKRYVQSSRVRRATSWPRERRQRTAARSCARSGDSGESDSEGPALGRRSGSRPHNRRGRS